MHHNFTILITTYKTPDEIEREDPMDKRWALLNRWDLLGLPDQIHLINKSFLKVSLLK